VKKLAVIRKVSEYMEEILTHYNVSKAKKHYFFRGQNKETYTLLPSVYRPLSSGKVPDEKLILLDFKQYASNLNVNYDFIYDAEKVWCDIQHYGLPTRLLDWTISPLVALFFACYNSKADYTQNGRVYILDPWGYHTTSKVIDYSICDNHQIQILVRALLAYRWSDTDIVSYLSKRYPTVVIDPMKKELPVAYVSAFTNERKLSQKGAFMIWGNNKLPLEMMPPVNNHISYVEIEEKAKPRILDELNALFVNEYSVYPDFEGMHKMINKRGSLFNL